MIIFAIAVLLLTSGYTAGRSVVSKMTVTTAIVGDGGGGGSSGGSSAGGDRTFVISTFYGMAIETHSAFRIEILRICNDTVEYNQI